MVSNHLRPMGFINVFVAMNDEQMLWVEEHDYLPYKSGKEVQNYKEIIRMEYGVADPVGSQSLVLSDICS